MKVLILSISKKSGHTHAANALESTFKATYPDFEILNQNFFDCIKNPYMEQMVNTTYLGILKTTPEIWDYLYDNDKFVERIKHLRNWVNRQTANKFLEVYQDIKPDVVVCTQAFPCEVSSSLKESGTLNFPLVAVVTDFIPHGYWVHPEVDLYTVPSQACKDDLVAHGIQPDKIKILGIPILCEFEKEITQTERNQIKLKFCLNPDIPIILLMGGSQGFGPMDRILQVINDARLKVQIIAVAGVNNKLRRNLLKIKEESQLPISIYGYVNNIRELMIASDLLITKPGGITSTEALSLSLPMIIIHPLPGQEQNNSDFLVNCGAALRVDEETEIPGVISSLISNPTQLSDLKANMKKVSIPHSSRNIIDSIVDLTKNFKIST